MTGRDTAIALGAVITGAVIGGAGYKLFFAEGLAIDKVTAEATEKPGANENLKTENIRLKTKIEKLNVELQRKKLAEAEAEKKAEETPVKTDEEKDGNIAVAFDDPRFQETLAKIDWATVGANMKDMVPLIAKIAEGMAKGEQMDLAMQGELQKLNGDLMKAAQIIVDGKIPGAGINGSFTHPVVVANQFSSALKAAGLELDAQQEKSLKQMMEFYSAKDASLRQAEGYRELSIENLAEEAEFKDAFYKEARSLMSEEQQSALFSEHSKGRVGFDLFDSSLMLGQYAKPIRVKDATELASTLSQRFQSAATLSDGAKKRLDTIITKWSRSIPADYWTQEADLLENRGLMKSDRIHSALRRQQALMRNILANVDFSAKDRAVLQKQMMIFVPLPSR